MQTKARKKENNKNSLNEWCGIRGCELNVGDAWQFCSFFFAARMYVDVDADIEMVSNEIFGAVFWLGFLAPRGKISIRLITKENSF